MTDTSAVSNSCAYPIARTGRKDEAYQIAQRLLNLVDVPGGHVDLRAITDTHSGLPRYVAALPAAVLCVEIPGTLAERARDLLIPHIPPESIGPWGDGLNVILRADQAPSPDLLSQLPPLQAEVDLRDEPIQATDPAPWLDLTGADRASIMWRLGGWPALPDLGLSAQHKHARVQLTINGRDIDELRPAPDHTVYVHVGGWDEEELRADWLARQLGYAIIDPPEWGW
jgi:hypothetical protein